MKKIIAYPVWFRRKEDGSYLCANLDFPVYTEGKDLEDTILMARDAIELMSYDYLEAGKELPVANMALKDDDYEFMSLVDCDITRYKRLNDSKKVKKNCTIPQGIAELAEEKGINFSKVLKEALLKELKRA